MGDPKRGSCEPMEKVNFGKNGGIVNGAKWYSVRGGMQDFNYLSSNDFEITLELGCKKYPDASELEKEWNNNKNALINFMWQVGGIRDMPFPQRIYENSVLQAHIGVKGLVRDAITGSPIANAVIHVQNITEIPGDEYGEPRDIDHDVTSGKSSCKI